MKSYKDKQLLIGLVLLGLAAGGAGRFFESEHFSFPSGGQLNSAAAILATQENLARSPAPLPTPEAPVFSRAEDCTTPMSIKTEGDATVGFLCLKTTDKNFDEKILAATKQANKIIVSLDKKDPKASKRALAAGAASVVWEK
jgi:hypothetical protein